MSNLDTKGDICHIPKKPQIPLPEGKQSIKSEDAFLAEYFVSGPLRRPENLSVYCLVIIIYNLDDSIAIQAKLPLLSE